MKVPPKMMIYNLFPLLAGPFPSWEAHFPRIKRMGFNWVFTNPVQAPGSSGSIYSIADYFALNRALMDPHGQSSDAQLKAVVVLARRMGLRMMIDLVINHCSVDSRLLANHPEWFLWESPGHVLHPSADQNGTRVVWQDLAQFDHSGTRDKEGLFNFFKSVTEHLISLGFEGFRCDAAYQVPQSLWEGLIKETKARHPDVLFLAETLGCPADLTVKTAAAGFDYIFNSSKWWNFSSPWLMAQYHLTREVAPSISFPESHDTVRLCEELNGSLAGLKQRYIFAALFSAGVMATIGYEFGFRRKLHVVNTSPSDWEQTGVDLTAFIAKVNAIKETYAIFQEEAPTQLYDSGNERILLMWKGSTGIAQESLLILNKDIYQKQRFRTDNLFQFVQRRAPMIDVSPDTALEYLPERFSYDLLPGQVIVLVTKPD
jgi:starch synthase (maltosyl-transferring)